MSEISAQQVVTVEVTPGLAEQVVTVDVTPGLAQQVVLVEVEVVQGPPGAQGPAGPDMPPPQVADLGKVAIVRDKGSGPQWAADLVTPVDVHTLGALATLDQVDTPQIVDGAVLTIKLADGSVLTAKVADLAITTPKLADAAVTNPKLGLLAVATGNLQDASVSAPKLAASAVTTAAIANANVTAPKLAAGAATGNIGYTPANKAGDDFRPGNVTAAKIIAGSDAKLSLESVAGTSAALYLNHTPDHYFQATLPSGGLDYFVNGVSAFRVSPAGISAGPAGPLSWGATAADRSWLSLDEANGYRWYCDFKNNHLLKWQANGSDIVTISNTGLVTAVSLILSTALAPHTRFQMFSENTASPTFSQITWDNANNFFMRHNWSTGVLSWNTSVKANAFTIDANGNVAAAGLVTALSAPQFDHLNTLATTGFVQRALGNFSAYIGISANALLTAAQTGAIVTAYNTCTLTLPVANTLLTGAGYFIQAAAGITVTIKAGASDLIWNPNVGNAATFTLAGGKSVHVITDAVAGWVVAGTGV